LPAVHADADPVWHLFVVRHPRRDDLLAHLAAAGVGAQVHYPIPPHQSRAYMNGNWAGGPLPLSERLASQVLSLPMGPHLSAADVEQVCSVVRSFRPAQRRAA
jgi:dTDP-4-amino-4,6-dideoxygalactose transaminase